MALHTCIHLSELEESIFDVLTRVRLHSYPEVVLRVAGGWVRDKVLGKASHDIDIAIEGGISGLQFAEAANHYIQSKGEETHRVGVIQRNPEQSKHLETATVKIMGLWIDFVNLRSESYANGTRIPSIEQGTPEEDAFRRDLTINALFYNINVGMVEDLTGMGFSDLRNGLVRTPLAPLTTFLDDPLRVLRAVRFASRFAFELDPTLKSAAQCIEVKQAIRDKISRERVGLELTGMLAGPNPLDALRLLIELGLFTTVFQPPTKAHFDFAEAECISPGTMEQVDLVTANLHTEMDRVQRVYQIMWSLNPALSEAERRNALVAGCLLPYGALQCPKITNPKRPASKSMSVASFVVRESLRWSSQDAVCVGKAIELCDAFAACAEVLMQPHAVAPLRRDLGLLIRQAGDTWRVCLTIAASKVPSLTTSLAHLERTVFDWQLEQAWEIKPMINGRDMISLLGLPRGGPIIATLSAKLIAWQLEHPQGTEEEAKVFLSTQKI